MAKKDKHVKTNALRMVESAGMEYELLEYDVSGGFVSGVDAAEKTGRNPEEVYKTLVTVANTKENIVFVIPVAEELDLKKAARVAGVKKIEMIPMKNLTQVTGYIKGGCSPVGMKKQFPTFIDDTAEGLEKIYVSAGKPGMSMLVDTMKLAELIDARFGNVTVN